jgi:hypothetical protein
MNKDTSDYTPTELIRTAYTEASETLAVDVLHFRIPKDSITDVLILAKHTRVYPKVSGLAAWSENFKR